MLTSMIGVSFFVFCFVLLAFTSPLTAVNGKISNRVIMEKSSSINAGNVRRRHRVSPNLLHTLVIALSSSNWDFFEQKVQSISDPNSALYGKYMTKNEVTDETSHMNSCRYVVYYLVSFNITPQDLSCESEYLIVVAPVRLWESLFHSEFYLFESIALAQPSQSLLRIVRAEEYSLPFHLTDHIQNVFNIVQFPPSFLHAAHSAASAAIEFPRSATADVPLKSRSSQERGAAVMTEGGMMTMVGAAYKVDSDAHLANLSSSTFDDITTPELLRRVYAINDAPNDSLLLLNGSSGFSPSSSTPAIFEFSGQIYNESDYYHFQSIFLSPNTNVTEGTSIGFRSDAAGIASKISGSCRIQSFPRNQVDTDGSSETSSSSFSTSCDTADLTVQYLKAISPSTAASTVVYYWNDTG
jgi:hypothetical protein